MRGIVLLVHGSKDPQWLRPFEDIVARARLMAPDKLIHLAVLEPVPTLGGAVAELVAEGATAIEVVPGLLSGGGRHGKHDVPALLNDIRRNAPEVSIDLRDGALGDHPAIAEAIARVLVAQPGPVRGA